MSVNFVHIFWVQESKLKVTKFNLPLPKHLSTVVKNTLVGAINPMSNSVKRHSIYFQRQRDFDTHTFSVFVQTKHILYT